MEKSLSDFEVDRLLELYANHEHEIGSLHEDASSSGLKKTDCITYSINVLEDAFMQIGDKTSAKKVRSLGRYGHELAKYLIKSHGWKTVYVTQDFWHLNVDLNSAHYSEDIESYTALHGSQLKHRKYYAGTADLPVHYFAINFSPHSRPMSYHCHTFFDACATEYDGSVFARGIFNASKRNVETERDANALSFLNQVKFGFGLSKGGKHTWLFSKGYVYEVHWDGADKWYNDSLYERTDIVNWSWVANLLVVPPDTSGLLNLKTRL